MSLIGIESREKIQFDTYATMFGGSVFIKLPPSFLSHLCLKELKADEGPDKIPIKLQAEYKDEHGEYGSFWNPAQQTADGEDE